jgi:ATP adenylyltransferase
MECPFCEIDKEKTKIIKQGKHCYVCFSNPRLMPGHLLVISKRHVEKISELNKEEREELIDFVVEYQDKIADNVEEGCDIRQNYRPFQAQDGFKLDHLHIHLQPREFEDELYKKSQIFEKDIFKSLTQEEINRINKSLI